MTRDGILFGWTGFFPWSFWHHIFLAVEKRELSLWKYILRESYNQPTRKTILTKYVFKRFRHIGELLLGLKVEKKCSLAYFIYSQHSLRYVSCHCPPFRHWTEGAWVKSPAVEPGLSSLSSLPRAVFTAHRLIQCTCLEWSLPSIYSMDLLLHVSSGFICLLLYLLII